MPQTTPLSDHALPPNGDREPRQTFTNFVSNTKHRLVLAALRELVLGRPDAVNPIVLTGASGTGKTHLLRAVAVALNTQAEQNALKIAGGKKTGGTREPFLPEQDSVPLAIVLGADEAAQRILAGDRADSATMVRATFMTMPALLLDDLHTIQPIRVYEVLTGLIDAFLTAGRPVLGAGTGLPAAWPLTRPLRSRLHMGLVIELPEPDLDISLRFISQWMGQTGLTLERDAQLLLARNCQDLRRLAGLLRRIEVQRRLAGNTLSPAELEALVIQKGARPTLDSGLIIALAAKHFAVLPDDITGRSRRPDALLARQVAMYVCRQMLELSYPSIGELFGGKDHSTVIHAVKKIKRLQHDDSVTNNLITELTNECRQYCQ